MQLSVQKHHIQFTLKYIIFKHQYLFWKYAKVYFISKKVGQNMVRYKMKQKHNQYKKQVLLFSSYLCVYRKWSQQLHPLEWSGPQWYRFFELPHDMVVGRSYTSGCCRHCQDQWHRCTLWWSALPVPRHRLKHASILVRGLAPHRWLASPVKHGFVRCFHVFLLR